MTRIGLMMIVKDEAPVIERCLSSLLPFVDWWVIADTGSTDGTQEAVQSAMSGIPGELVERPWVDFGHNRQEVLELARTSAHARADDYLLWIDADEQLTGLPETRPTLSLDGYHLQVDYASVAYRRLCLVRLSSPWRWEGVLHEHLVLEDGTTGDLPAPRIRVEHDGARSQDPDTYRRDAALLTAALERDPGHPRHQFYLAQSWRDAGEPERALAAYRRRAENTDGWEQERWYARFQAAVMTERLGAPDDEVAAAYLTAYQECPWRAEPLVALSRVERGRERYAVALLYARPASRLPMPGGEALFVHTDDYTWAAWDEVAVNCYWTGQYDEGAAAARRALEVRPDDERLRANLAWCEAGARG